MASPDGMVSAAPPEMSRVLLVDDSEDLLDLYRILLEGKGYEVDVALDGESGLERVRTFRPDVVVLDMMMPVLDGLGFLARLSAESSSPPPRVIASSGFDQYRDEALRRGAHAFLRKPIGLDVLVSAIAAAVPGQRIAHEKLAANEREVSRSRERSREVAAAALAKLTDDRKRIVAATLEALVVWLRRYYGFGECFLHLAHGENIYLEASSGSDPSFLHAGMEYPRRNAYCEYVIDVGSTLYLSDPLHHPVSQFAQHNEVRMYGWHFYIGAPLATPSGAVLGTLCMMDRTPHQMYPEDVRLFEALAAQAAIALVGAVEGQSIESVLIDTERVFARAMLDLVLCTAIRRTARTQGALQVASFGMRGRADHAAAVRTAYGVTSGLRFAIAASPQRDQWVLLHDGVDADVVDNNVEVAHRLIAPLLTSFEKVAWSGTEHDGPCTSEVANAVGRRLLESLRIA
jgi:CheY-like chemotaxis protein